MDPELETDFATKTIDIVLSNDLTPQQKLDEMNVVGLIHHHEEDYLNIIFCRNVNNMEGDTYTNSIRLIVAETIYQLIVGTQSEDLQYFRDFLIRRIRWLYSSIKSSLVLQMCQTNTLDLVLDNKWIVDEEIRADPCVGRPETIQDSFVFKDPNHSDVLEVMRFIIQNSGYFVAKCIWYHIWNLFYVSSIHRLEVLKLCVKFPFPLLSDHFFEFYLFYKSGDIRSDILGIIDNGISDGSFVLSQEWAKKIIKLGIVDLLKVFVKHNINIRELIKGDHTGNSREIVNILTQLDISLDDYIRIKFEC